MHRAGKQSSSALANLANNPNSLLDIKYFTIQATMFLTWAHKSVARKSTTSGANDNIVRRLDIWRLSVVDTLGCCGCCFDLLCDHPTTKPVNDLD